MYRRMLWLSIAVPALASCGRGISEDSIMTDDPKRLTITLTSPAFSEGMTIPRVYTCDGEDISPPLAWSGVPEATRSLALICDDPDAPRGTWTHWVLYDLPADVTQLQEGIPPHEQVNWGRAVPPLARAGTTSARSATADLARPAAPTATSSGCTPWTTARSWMREPRRSG